MAKVIKVENLSKAYQLGDFGTGTISRDLERFWARIRGKEDPFLKIGEVNDRTIKGESDIVWSLKDLTFEIEQGDAVGVIGRNGAGKSTLLKILSRVTTPTTGSVKVKGRIASLLEVGTGFHPELSGKENIYLNGAILGMRKAEIKRKFDEIVDFAGVERYIDTPVKRYSSGMYVRLAFAVAAHLESEILVVDEVLAVGDAEFQRKCLGKMGDVSKNEGRTILFVSHNMENIQNLCKKSILLKNGYLEDFDDSENVIKEYLSDRKSAKKSYGTKEVMVQDIEFLNDEGMPVYQLTTNQKHVFKLTVISSTQLSNISFAICFNNINRVRACSLWTNFNGTDYAMEKGKYILTFEIDSLALTAGIYELITYIEHKGNVVERIDEYMDVVVNNDPNYKGLIQPSLVTGAYVQLFTSEIVKIND